MSKSNAAPKLFLAEVKPRGTTLHQHLRLVWADSLEDAERKVRRAILAEAPVINITEAIGDPPESEAPAPTPADDDDSNPVLEMFGEEPNV